jgi:release factor glutamine methyltransferase
LLRQLFRKIATRFYKPILAHYLSRPKVFIHAPFRLIILPGVFHPGFFYSTKFLLQYLQQINFSNKSVIEVGAGNGLISFSIALKAQKVVALELSKEAIKGLQMNEQENKMVLPKNVLQIVESNLFKAIEPFIFDYIVVNPPYYPNKINNEAELAWNCGEEFQYFKKFFFQVVHFMNPNSKIIMVLSSQCNLNEINKIAKNNDLIMELKATKKFLIEDNYIFEIYLSEKSNLTS